MRDAHPRFSAAGIRVYALSYDDPQVLREFAESQQIPFPLLSDLDSAVIRKYGILNDRIQPSDAFLWGIPYPGVYVTDEKGIVTAKFFHDTYKKRDSPEILLDAALGRLELSENTPRSDGSDPEVRVAAVIHGGKGTIRQGVRRQLVVRFQPSEGLHLYGVPAPPGMTPTRVSLTGPPGLITEDPIMPPTRVLHLDSLDLDLLVYDGAFDIVIPFYADGQLASEVRPLAMKQAELEVHVRYQACNNEICLLPKTETLSISVPLDVVDVPALGIHQGHGQREGEFSAGPHMRRMVLRSFRRHPLGFLQFLAKNLRLNRAARHRRRSEGTDE